MFPSSTSSKQGVRRDHTVLFSCSLSTQFIIKVLSLYLWIQIRMHVNDAKLRYFSICSLKLRGCFYEFHWFVCPVCVCELFPVWVFEKDSCFFMSNQLFLSFFIKLYDFLCFLLFCSTVIYGLNTLTSFGFLVELRFWV